MAKNSKLFAISAGFKPFLLTACEHLRANSWDYGLTGIDARVLRSFGLTESSPRYDFKGFLDEGGGSDCQSEPTWLQRTIDTRVKWMLGVTAHANDGQHQHFLRCQQPCQSNESADEKTTSVKIFASTQRKTEPTRTKSSSLDSKDPIGTQMLTGSGDGNARFCFLRRCSVNVEWM